jgi:hypothetical protein
VSAVAEREALVQRVASVAAQVGREIASPPAVPTRTAAQWAEEEAESRAACVALLALAADTVAWAEGGWPATRAALLLLAAAAEVVAHAPGLYDEEQRDAGYVAECARGAVAYAGSPAAVRCAGLLTFLAIPVENRWMGE